jgi:hypothetical protein
MKHLLSKLSELLTLPTRAIQLLLKNQAVDELTKLLVRFIQALGLNLDDTIIHTLVLSLVTTVIYFVIGWITSYFSKEEKDEESISIPDLDSEADCCDFDFSVDNCCDCEFK